MCRENTQKPQIPHCRCTWKGPPSKITLSAQTASLIVGCLSDGGCWDVTPLIESHNKDPCLACSTGWVTTVITTITWLFETSNGIVEAAGICIGPFDLGNLNKASSHTAQGVKVTAPCPPLSACQSCLCLTSIVVNILDTNATERYKSHVKDKYNPGLTEGLFICYTQTETDIMLATYQQQSKSLGDGGLHFSK